MTRLSISGNLPAECGAMSKPIANMRRRLERWELEHLRTLAAELAERTETLERELNYANDRAEWLERNLHDLNNDFAERGIMVGITKDGQMGVAV